MKSKKLLHTISLITLSFIIAIASIFPLATTKDLKVYADTNPIYLNNGSFNEFESENSEKPYPATAKEFTVTLGTSNGQVYGVVNTEETNFNQFLADSALPLSNPKPNTNDNLMLLYNSEADTITLTSAERTLSANSYYVIGYDYLKINNAKVRLSLVSNVDGNDIELAGTILATNEDHSPRLYIHTAETSIKVKLKLTMTTTAAGYLFVDDAIINYNMDQKIAKTTYETFVSSYPNSSAKADLDNTLYSITIEDQTIIPYFVSDNDYVFVTGTEILDLTDTQAGLKISTDHFVNFSTTANWSKSLSSNSYYKYEMDIKTANLLCPDTATDNTKIGAKIRLTNLNTDFGAINTNGEWTHYTFYIKTESAKTTYLQLGLGSVDCPTSGELYVANVNVTKLDGETAYNSATENLTTKVVDLTTTTETTDTDTTDSDKTDKTTEDNTDKYAWIRYLSLILFPIIILLVILVFALRGLFKKVDLARPKTKNLKSSYDRTHTLSVQSSSKQALGIREKQVLDLKNKIQDLKQEKLNQDAIYKNDLKTLREVKKKTTDKKEIKSVEKKANATKHLIALITSSIDKLNKKVKKLNSEDYLKKLTRKCEATEKKMAKKDNKAV